MPEPIRLHDTAFPLQGFAVDAISGAYTERLVLSNGLSKREWFAAMALCGIMTRDFAPWDAAEEAIRAADYLLEKLT